jgi:hypothetical protein
VLSIVYDISGMVSDYARETLVMIQYNLLMQRQSSRFVTILFQSVGQTKVASDSDPVRSSTDIT